MKKKADYDILSSADITALFKGTVTPRQAEIMLHRWTSIYRLIKSPRITAMWQYLANITESGNKNFKPYDVDMSLLQECWTKWYTDLGHKVSDANDTKEQKSEVDNTFQPYYIVDGDNIRYRVKHSKGALHKIPISSIRASGKTIEDYIRWEACLNDDVVILDKSTEISHK